MRSDVIIFSATVKEKNSDKDIACKLHRQFAHPSRKSLLKLINNAGIKDSNLEKEVSNVSNKCITCIKYRKPFNRPVVCMPLASEFNEMIGIDLKIWGNQYFLVIVDIATRFCAARVIEDKLPSTIVRGLFLSWVATFGPPKKLISDNGGEFSNSAMRDFSEAFSIKVIHTAAESPWSNGIVERLNGVLGKLVLKILDDVNCDTDIALAWAVAARNAYYNNSGYSPNQLVFGFNPAMPTVYNSKPPGLKKMTSSEIMAKLMDAKRVAMEGFIKYESCERIYRAVNSNVRRTLVEDLQVGDEVYYQRNKSKEWYGPGKVMLIEGQVITVKHGNVTVKVSTVSLVRVPHICTDECEKNNYNNKNEQKGASEEIQKSEEEREAEENQEMIPARCRTENKGVKRKPEKTEASDKRKKQRLEHDIISRDWSEGDRFQGIDSVTGEHVSGKILSKVKGNKKNLYNIQSDQDGYQGWFDMDEVKDIEAIGEDIEMVVLYNNNYVAEAKREEMENWIANGVFEPVDNEGQRYMSVRWVITEKVKAGFTYIKARLVVRGFEENTSELKKDSPTCSREAIRILITIASSMKWKCHSIDIKSAYLQGNTIQRNIFLKPPKEYDDGKLWKLKKTVYGLCDAARAWYMRVKEELKMLSIEMCSMDNSLFYWRRNGVLEGIICIYVDDFLYAGTQRFCNMVIEKLKEKFLIGSAESLNFTYVGLRIQSYKDGWTIDQNQYIAGLDMIPINKQRASEKKEALDDKEKKEYRALVGQLNWISTHTRPDIAFETCMLSSAFHEAKVADLTRLNKLVERVKRDKVNIYFPRINNIREVTLECYTDASLHNLQKGNSQGGLIIFLKDRSGYKCPLYWRSKKLERKVKSTIAAESLALNEGAERSIYLAHILRQLVDDIRIKIRCYTDNKSLVEALASSKKPDDPMLSIDTLILKEHLERRIIESVEWIRGEQQLADPLTKIGVCTDKLKNELSRD